MLGQSEDVGDTTFLLEEQVTSSASARKRSDHRRWRRPRRAVRPLGITKASLSTDSFISAASFKRPPRPYRSGRRGQGGLSPRPQGKRHHGRYPRGNGPRALIAAFIADGMPAPLPSRNSRSRRAHRREAAALDFLQKDTEADAATEG